MTLSTLQTRVLLKITNLTMWMMVSCSYFQWFYYYYYHFLLLVFNFIFLCD